MTVEAPQRQQAVRMRLAGNLRPIYFLVGRVGLEPTTKGFRFVQLSLLPGLCLRHITRDLGGRRLVSTPSAGSHPRLGSALAYLAT